jgi:hypothetical protein
MGGAFAGGGQFAGPSATPLGQGLSSALGLQGGALPGIDAAPGPVVPVAVVVDSSDRLSRGLIEPRGVAAGKITPGAGQFVTIFCQAATGGGFVLEQLRLNSAGTSWRTLINPQPVLVGFAEALTNQWNQISVGGEPLAGRFRAGTVTFPVTGGAPVDASIFSASLIDLRWFCPPGQCLQITADTAAIALTGGIVVFRELLE